MERTTAWCHCGNIACRLVRKPQVDATTEGFLKDSEANGFLKRVYRAHWVVTEKV